eukprot:scaffold18456_cov30-Phaeocystis_antarctica.AAC.2
MEGMFNVRSARAPAHRSPVGPSPARCMSRCRPTPFPPLGPHAASIVCPPCDSAVCVGVQPAAELRHVQSHRHGGHVQCALRMCPAPPIPIWALACTLHAPRPPHAFSASRPACRQHRMPSLRLGSTRRRSTSR